MDNNIDKKCEECRRELEKCLKCSRWFETENYETRRWSIFFAFIAILIVGIITLLDVDFKSVYVFLSSQKYLTGFFAGLFGLLLRNIYWIIGDHPPEKRGKYLEATYVFQYPFFIALSSILIFAILNLNYKIETHPDLFYAFAIPLNIYLGYGAYGTLDFLKGLIGKNF